MSKRRRITTILGDREYRMIVREAHLHGISVSEWLRNLIHRAMKIKPPKVIEPSRLDCEATEWLARFLAGSVRQRAQVLRAAEARSFGERLMLRAAERLGLDSTADEWRLL